MCNVSISSRTLDDDSAFKNIEYISGYFVLENNGMLSQMVAPTLAGIGSDLRIDSNDVLEAVVFANLTNIEGGVSVQDNDMLQGINLQALDNVGGGIEIENNNMLKMVNFGSFKQISNLTIRRNPSLTSLEFKVQSSYLSFPIEITENDKLAEVKTDSSIRVSTLLVQGNGVLNSIDFKNALDCDCDEPGITIRNNVNLTSLESSFENFEGCGYCDDGTCELFIDIQNNSKLSLMDNCFAALEHVQDVILCENGLLALDHVFPKLLDFNSMNITKNDELESVTFPTVLNSYGYVDISDNAALENIKFPNLTMVGDVTIQDNARLGSLNFPSLQTANNIIIEQNENLSLVEFAKLKNCSENEGETSTCELSISNNPKLEFLDSSFPDFNGHSGTNITIRNNTVLQSLNNAFTSLQNASIVSISENLQLNSLNGTFKNLKYAQQKISISNNTNLRSMSNSFSSVTSGENDPQDYEDGLIIEISGNEKLTSLEGIFSSLKGWYNNNSTHQRNCVSTSINIMNNSALKSLNGSFSSLYAFCNHDVSIYSINIRIHSNPSLCTSNVESFCDVHGVNTSSRFCDYTGNAKC